MAKVILASASTRRKDLLAQVGVDCEVQVSDIDENIDAEEPGALVEALASAKATNIADQQEGDFVVIGADTVVVKDGEVYGKPSNEEEATKMLTSLQGDRHEVYTGVTLISVAGGEGLIDTFHVRTIVDMMPMSEAQIKAYIKSGEPMDKAGGYGIQGKGAAYIRDVAGDFFNVVGLPISTVLSHLESMGVNLYQQ